MRPRPSSMNKTASIVAFVIGGLLLAFPLISYSLTNTILFNPSMGAQEKNETVTVDSLKPPGCPSATTLTNLRTGTEASNPTTTNDLVLGSTGDDTLNGGDGDDCISTGSGTDTVDGGNGTDTCLGNAATVFLNCETEDRSGPA